MNGRMTRRQFVLGSLGVVASAGVLLNHGYRMNDDGPAYQFWHQRHKGTLTDLEYIALYGALAPSAHNTQPWKYHLPGNRIEPYADRSRDLGSADRHQRLLLMSVGCSLENLALAAERLGYIPTIAITADREFEVSSRCATLALTKAGRVRQSQRFDAISHRQTTRAGFDVRHTVPAGLKRCLGRESAREGLGLALRYSR